MSIFRPVGSVLRSFENVCVCTEWTWSMQYVGISTYQFIPCYTQAPPHTHPQTIWGQQTDGTKSGYCPIPTPIQGPSLLLHHPPPRSTHTIHIQGPPTPSTSKVHPHHPPPRSTHTVHIQGPPTPSTSKFHPHHSTSKVHPHRPHLRSIPTPSSSKIHPYLQLHQDPLSVAVLQPLRDPQEASTSDR